MLGEILLKCVRCNLRECTPNMQCCFFSSTSSKSSRTLSSSPCLLNPVTQCWLSFPLKWREPWKKNKNETPISLKQILSKECGLRVAVSKHSWHRKSLSHSCSWPTPMFCGSLIDRVQGRLQVLLRVFKQRANATLKVGKGVARGCQKKTWYNHNSPMRWGHSISNPKHMHSRHSLPASTKEDGSHVCMEKSLCMSSFCQNLDIISVVIFHLSRRKIIHLVSGHPYLHSGGSSGFSTTVALGGMPPDGKESWDCQENAGSSYFFNKCTSLHFAWFFFLLAHSKLISLYRMSVIFLTWSSGISQRRCRVLLCRPAASYNISTGTIHQAKGTKDIFSYMFSSIPWDVSMLENKATTDDCPKYRAA